MATKKTKVEKTAKKKELKKTVKKSVAKKTAAKPKGKSLDKKSKKRKCCPNCPDYEHCDDKSGCCDYCDYCLNGKCTHGKKKGIPSVNDQIELSNCRGDDYGIDDYEAYESAYE